MFLSNMITVSDCTITELPFLATERHDRLHSMLGVVRGMNDMIRKETLAGNSWKNMMNR